MKHQRIAFVVMVALIALAPIFIYPVFLMKVMCFALFACAFNLLIGYGGLLSFGHAMFLGTAGYAAAHSAKVWGFPPEAAILFGTACAFALGVVTGLLAIRRQGIYFAMITLALAQMMFFYYLQAPFTGGEDGIQAVPRGHLFGFIDLSSIWTMYVTVAVVFLGGFLLIYRVIHSPFGQVLKAIRENEPRALSLGYDTARYKLLAYVLSGTLARVPARLAHRCALDHVGRGGADDAARRHGHHLRTGGRRAHHHLDAELPRAARRLGHHRAGRHFRHLRADLPPRRGRRAGELPQEAALVTASRERAGLFP
jgi:ribose/xylose/arabinose/galactoside ABC-type transport system permease subunit